MSIINKLSLKYLKNNKRKVIVIVLNIILSTMLLFTVALGASTLRGHSVKDSINHVGEHHVIYKNLSYNLYDNLINDKKINDVIVMQEEKITYEDNSYKIVSFNKDIDEYIILDSGRYPENNNEIIVSNKSNYKVNNSIGSYRIVGLYNEVKRTLELDDLTLITKDNLKNNLNANYLVKFKNSIRLYNEIYRKADEFGLKYTFDHTGARVYEQAEENGWLLQSLGHYPKVKTQIGMYSMFLVILLAISMFCVMTIKNAFEISLSERKKYFGTLRSIGTSKKQIFKIILFETTLLSIISIPIGLLLGYRFTYLLVSIVNNMMGEINTFNYEIIVYPVYMIIAFIFILITIIYSAIKPAKKSSEISPIEIIKENKTYYYEKSKENYPIIKKIFGIEGELAYKTIKRNGIKSSVIVNSLVVSIILFITLSTFVNFLRNNWELENNHNNDITIYAYNFSNDYKALDEIANIKEADNINIYRRITLNFKKDSSMLTNKAISHYQNNRHSFISLMGVHQSQYEQLKKEIGLTEDVPILYNYGDYFENNNNKKVKWFNDKIREIEICSIIDDYQNNVVYNKNCYYKFDKFYLLNDKLIDVENFDPMIVVPITWLDKFVVNYKNYINSYEGVNAYEESKQVTIEIDAKNYIEVDKELQTIFNKYSKLELDSNYYNNPLENHEENVTLSTISLVINIVMTFIVIISLTSIINTINTNLLLRETEFSVLRSIGLSKKGLNKMLLFESIFLCIKTLLLGIPSATFFVGLLMYFSFLLTKDLLEFPVSAYLIAFVGIIIIIFIMNEFSNNKIKKNNIIDSIRKNSICFSIF